MITLHDNGVFLTGGIPIGVAVPGLGVDSSVLAGVGIPGLRGDDEDIFGVVELHPVHLTALYHLQKVAVLDVDGGGLAAGAAHDAAGIAENDGQQQGPAHQGGHAPPVSAGLVVFPVVFVVVWVHVWDSFQGKTCQYRAAAGGTSGPARAEGRGPACCPGGFAPAAAAGEKA